MACPEWFYLLDDHEMIKWENAYYDLLEYAAYEWISFRAGMIIAQLSQACLMFWWIIHSFIAKVICTIYVVNLRPLYTRLRAVAINKYVMEYALIQHTLLLATHIDNQHMKVFYSIFGPMSALWIWHYPMAVMSEAFTDLISFISCSLVCSDSTQCIFRNLIKIRWMLLKYVSFGFILGVWFNWHTAVSPKNRCKTWRLISTV